MQETGQFTQRLLFKSFLVLVFGFILTFVLAAVLIGLIGLVMFPETINLIGEDPEVFDAAVRANPGGVMPPAFCWTSLAVFAVVGFGSGYVVAWLAPFARFGHGVFLAVMLFVTFLQVLVSGGEFSPMWLKIALNGFTPIAALFGAKSCALKMLLIDLDSNEDQPND